MKAEFLILLWGILFFFPGCELLDELDTESDIRDEITGEWKVNEDSELFKKKLTSRYYTVYITKDPVDSAVIYIDGFYEIDDKVKVLVDDLSLTIPDQSVSSYDIEDGYGSIAYNFKSINFSYYVDLGDGQRDVVSAEYTRSE